MSFGLKNKNQKMKTDLHQLIMVPDPSQCWWKVERYFLLSGNEFMFTFVLLNELWELFLSSSLLDDDVCLNWSEKLYCIVVVFEDCSYIYILHTQVWKFLSSALSRILV